MLSQWVPISWPQSSQITSKSTLLAHAPRPSLPVSGWSFLVAGRGPPRPCVPINPLAAGVNPLPLSPNRLQLPILPSCILLWFPRPIRCAPQPALSLINYHSLRWFALIQNQCRLNEPGSGIITKTLPWGVGDSQGLIPHCRSIKNPIPQSPLGNLHPLLSVNLRHLPPGWICALSPRPHCLLFSFSYLGLLDLLRRPRWLGLCSWVPLLSRSVAALVTVPPAGFGDYHSILFPAIPFASYPAAPPRCIPRESLQSSSRFVMPCCPPPFARLGTLLLRMNTVEA